MNHITELSDKYNSLFDGWFKNLTALSIGALTVLVSLMPQDNIPCPAKYFLIACWVLLGVSNLFFFAFLKTICPNRSLAFPSLTVMDLPKCRKPHARSASELVVRLLNRVP